MTHRSITMRAQFDTSFSLPIRRDQIQLMDVLTLRIDQELCAVRLAEVAHMTTRPILTVVPATSPSLLGLSESRGRVVAVFDLSALLGGPRAEPRWLIVPSAEPGIGFVFEHFEGHRKVEAIGGGETTSAGRLIPLSAPIDAVRALGSDQPNLSGETS